MRALDSARFRHEPPRVRRKREVLWLKSQGLAHQDIARLASVTGKTLRRYFQEYVEGGFEGLKEWRFRRPQSELLSHREAIVAYFRDHPPASIQEAGAAITRLTGLTRSPTQVRVFLKEKCGLKRRKTGTLPAKTDPEAQETFKKTTSNHVWRKPRPASAPSSL